MITCTTCGKLNTNQPVGDHWICGDCRLDTDVSPEITTSKPKDAKTPPQRQ